MTRAADLRARFADLHRDPPAEPTPGILVMPNPWDVGSAKILTTLGFYALATTSAGFAGSLGRQDQHDPARGVDRPRDRARPPRSTCRSTSTRRTVSPTTSAGVIETVALLDATDAAGFSIEDYDPRADVIRPIEAATERVAAARSASADLVLTARAENLLHGIADLDDTIARLVAYRDAGADVLYAPGLSKADDIARVVAEVGAPINVLALPGTPPVPELAALGVARISVGSLFAWAAYGVLAEAASELMGPGTTEYVKHMLSGELRRTAFS